MTPRPRTIEYVPLEDLKADPKNPKSHSLDIIDASYDRFGVVDLITIDGRTGYIISGHGRTTVLRDMHARGEEPPEGVTVEEDGTWRVPVNAGWSSKNDAEAAAALIAMNRVTEMGGWVDETLLELLDEISASGAGFEGVGFSETDMDDLRHLLEDVPDLDELADEWDPDTAPGGSGGSSVTIKLSDAAVIEKWHATRDTVKTDDEAARILWGMAPAPKVSTKKATSRTADPEESDLETEPELDVVEAVAKAERATTDFMGQPALNEKFVHEARVHSVSLDEDGMGEVAVETDVSRETSEDALLASSDGLDWSTAETVTDGDFEIDLEDEA